ncbi:MAG: LCP family protein [Eubacteriales bacterium]|nr:LCP family protein [Eubacteriales bacterium]
MARTRKRFRWFWFILEVLVLLLLAAVLFAGAKLAKIGKSVISDSNLIKNENIPADEIAEMDGYTDIAFFGVDSREGALESGTNSDTIMVCSINNRTHEVKLVSVYRDTYLDTVVNGYNKCNSAYAVGGAEAAINMLNRNLDLNISDYVTVNFEALVDVIDMLGGVDINLTEGEVQWLNGYLVEERQVLGRECEDVSGPGLQHLNGMQALAYSRIRYIGLDYERTERQRTVLEQMLEKAGESNIFTLNEMLDTILPEISTSLSFTDLLKLATGIGGYEIGETQGFPFDKTTMDISAGDCVIPVNLEANVSSLHEFLYGSTGYTPSATVQEISNAIIAETGVS